MSKLTLKEANKRFKDNGCELLEKKYINSSTRMKYKCNCSKISKISLNCFSLGQRCRDCASKKIGLKLRYPYEYVKKYFEDNDCVLLSKEYKNNNTILDYICSCGCCAKISFTAFLNGQRCRDCASKKIGLKLRHPYEYVKKYFKDNDCVLLSKKYVNANEIMVYICSCGNSANVSFNNFQQGHRCSQCGIKKVTKAIRHTYEYIKKYFQDHECVLLSKQYENNSTILDYICSCGNKSKTRFSNFRIRPRCKKCGTEKISGPNNKKWNHNLTLEERLVKRNYPEYKEWRRNVYTRDYWTCVNCKKKKGIRINAHHIKSYSDNKKLRLDVNNGVTWCEECHKKFHKMYGHKNNDRKQYNEFMKQEINKCLVEL